MLATYFPRRPKVLKRLMRSRFLPDMEALVRFLEGRGHRPNTLAGYVRAGAHLIHCMDRGLVPLEGLTAKGLQEFARSHGKNCRCAGKRQTGSHFSSVAVHLFEVMKDRHGLGPPAGLIPQEAPVERVLAELNVFLRDTKGLCASTRERHLRDLRPLLVAKFGVEPPDFAALSVAEVRAWVSSRAAGCSPKTAKSLTSALRTFFRFLEVSGRPGAGLRWFVPSIRTTKLAHVPYGLDEDQLRRLFGAIDLSKAIGLRAAAMVQCLAVLGLRAGEVAALELADIDWDAGTLRLRGTKSRRTAMLPLPHAVGRSIAEYLRRGRPETNDRHVFVRHYMPVGLALRRSGVSCTIRRAIRRAKLVLPSSGAHILRHTAAGRLLRAGAKVKEVADVLRHRELDTTRIYAKVDWPRLAEVALRWPAEVHQ